MLNDYQYRPSEYSSILNSETCTNNLEFEGIVFGKFICPIVKKMNYLCLTALLYQNFKRIQNLIGRLRYDSGALLWKP